MSTLRLGYLNTNVALELSPGVESCTDRVLKFLGSHFTVGPSRTMAGPDVSVDMYPFSEFGEQNLGAGRETVMKLDSKGRGVVRGTRQHTHTGSLVVSTSSSTAYLFDHRSASAALYVSTESWREIVEFFRALVWSIEECKGTLVIHASAAEWRGGVVALAGAKGAGKTTTLLDLLALPGFRFVTGDKLFLTAANGVVLATGWPDFPHLGWGTIRARPGLLQSITDDLGLTPADEPTEGVVLPYDWFQSVIGFEIDHRSLPLFAIVLPRIGSTTGSVGGLHRTSTTHDDVTVLFEYRNRPADEEGWEPFFGSIASRTPNRSAEQELSSALLALPAYQRTGSGPLSDVEISDLRVDVSDTVDRWTGVRDVRRDNRQR